MANEDIGLLASQDKGPYLKVIHFWPSPQNIFTRLSIGLR